ncbi:MAG: hypothetical protein ACRC46_14865 [Thermoguttaceae bacterium]
MKNRVFVGLCCALLVSVLGCGTGHVPMGGMVTFSDDGSPLTAGTVCFETDSFYGRGELDEKGKYTLGFDKPGNGIPKGSYRVYVSGAQVEDGVIETMGSTGKSTRPKYKSLVDKKFESGATSGLTFVADGKENKFDFKVDRAK